MSKVKKILIGVGGAILLAAMIVGAIFIVKGCAGENINGTYYLYVNNALSKDVWVKLDGSKWSDYTGGSGKLERDGEKITVYDENGGSLTGQVRNGVLVLDAGLIKVYYCKEGKTPDDFNKENTDDKSMISVTFNANGGAFSGGDEINVVRIKKNTKFSSLEYPIRAGYELIGWATDKDGKTIWNPSSEKVTKEMTLYAVWKKAADAITAVKVPGASIKGYEIFIPLDQGTYSFDFGEKITSSSAYSWKLIDTFENGGEEITSKNVTGLNAGENKFIIVATPLYGGNETYYNVTVLVKSQITVTFCDGETEIQSVNLMAGDSFKPGLTPSVQGYTFNGWKTESGEAFSEGVIWVDTKLYIDKTPIEYRVYLNAAGGRLGENIRSVKFGEEFTLPVPTKDGQKFIGWYRGNDPLTDGNGKSIEGWNIPSDGIEVIAKYGDRVEITAESDSLNFGTVTGGGTYGVGERVTLTATPKFGYEFMGWSNLRYGGWESYDKVYTFIVREDTEYRMLAQFKERSDLYNYIFDVNGDDVVLTGLRDTSIYSLDIPDGVTEIRADALSGCYYLSSITIPASMKRIASGVFENYGSLRVTYKGTLADWCGISFGDANANPLSNGGSLNINGDAVSALVIPKTVERIEDFAFAGFTDAKNILIPSNVTYISPSAFIGCKNVERIIVEVTNKNYVSSGNCIIDRSNKTLIAGCKNSVIPHDGNVEIIGDGAFFGCDGLNTMIIPDGVKSIGRAAFYGCTGLSVVSIPQSVTSIGEYAFLMCSNLGSMDIPDGVKEIGQYTFNGCSSLKTVYIGEAVETIGDYAFAGCGSLTDVDMSGNLSFIGERAFASCLSLNRIELGQNVSHIEREAFLSCLGIECVRVPGALKTVGKDAFTGCGNFIIDYYGDLQSWCDIDGLKNLRTDRYISDLSEYAGGEGFITGGDVSGDTSDVTCVREVFFSGERLHRDIVIPAGVETIPDYAFAKMSNVSAVTISDGVKKIGEYAFSGCSDLTLIVVPGSLVSVGFHAFRNCGLLNRIDYNGDIFSWCNLSGVDNLRVNNASVNFTAVGGNGTLVIPDSITEINDGAFEYFSGIRNVIIPEGVTSIGDYAFRGCHDITSVELPDSLAYIGSYAFADCDNLGSIRIGSGVTSIGNYAFESCDSLQHLSFGATADSFGTGVFDNCNALNSLNFEGSIKDWCENEYVEKITPIYQSGYYSYELTIGGSKIPSKLTIPSGTKKIASRAFFKRTEITEVTIPSSVTSVGYGAFAYCTNLKNVVIENGVSALYDRAFVGCYALENLSIGQDVTFGTDVFAECENLKKLNYLGTSTDYSRCGYVKKLRGWNAPIEKITMNGSEFSEGVVVDSSVTELSDYSFYNCDKIKWVQIESGVTKIGKYAFYGCSSINLIYIGDKVISIGEYAFYGCSGIEEIDAGSGIRTIGQYAFGDCSKLTSISLGKSLYELGYYVFDNCEKLETVTYNGTKNDFNYIVSSLSNSRLGRNCAFKIVCNGNTSINYKG